MLGRVTQTTLPDGRRVSFEYDSGGRVTRLTAPGRPANVFAFSPTGARMSWASPAVADVTDRTEYRYDADGDVSSIVRPDGSSVATGRDGAGRVTRVAHPSGTVSLRYGGAAGQLDRVTHSGGQVVTWTHDGDLPVGETATGAVAGETRRELDGEGRLTRSTVVGSDPITYAYDTGGLVARGGALEIARNASTGFVSSTTLGSATSTYTYDAFGDPVTLGDAHSGAATFAESYVRDRGARITERTETTAGETHRFAYEYDAAGRLIEVSRDGTVRSSYGYDANGNRVTETMPAASADGHVRRPRPA